MKKFTLFLVSICWVASCYATSGFIPQGQKMANGQMNPKTVKNISRQGFLDFLYQGKIPDTLQQVNIYDKAWWNSSVIRTQYAELLRDLLCKQLGVNPDQLLVILKDPEQSPITKLNPGDDVYSNGVAVVNKKFAIVAAPNRKARKTMDGTMEDIMTLPGGLIVYMTCLNTDVSRQATGNQNPDIECV
jgi:hypothetical protein